MPFVSSKKPFSFSRYWNFCISIFPTVFYLPLLYKMIGEDKPVCDIMYFLNKKLITHFVWYLENEKRYDIKILFIDRVLNPDHFVEKSCRKQAPKASPRPLFKFGKYPQNNHCMQEIVLKIRYFERRFSKSLKKLNFTFSLSENHNHWVKLKKYNFDLKVL